MEGRDISAVVFPGSGESITRCPPRGSAASDRGSYGDRATEQVAAIEREMRMTRAIAAAHSPLRPAPDAIVMDTTDKPIEDVVDTLRALVSAKARGLASDA
jgi:cytidylate kinase